MDYVQDVKAFSSAYPASFTLDPPTTTVPVSATVQAAFVHLDTFSGMGSDATIRFAGTEFTASPIASDRPGSLQGLVLETYRFDVTSSISMPLAGSYQVEDIVVRMYNNFASLIIVYSDPSLPDATILINDGAESLQESSSTTTFSAMLAGPGTVTVVTGGDESSVSQSGEALLFNGVTIAGPGDIFNANLGRTASLVTRSVTVVAGNNDLTLTTTSDWLSWNLAILKVGATMNQPTTAVCQDATVQLDASGFVSVTANQIDNGSSDDSGIASLTTTPSGFSCEDVGENDVTLMVTANDGDEAACDAVVTVQDVTVSSIQEVICSASSSLKRMKSLC